MNAARTILIVDDSARMREVIVRCCTGPNDTVFQASNGREAVERFLERQPDWILMDVEMPGMDGFTATREILRQFSEARVVILTQHNSPDFRDEAQAAGACAFLSKDDLTQLRTIMNPANALTFRAPDDIKP
jgi:CheY-like chemotaxis protein